MIVADMPYRYEHVFINAQVDLSTDTIGCYKMYYLTVNNSGETSDVKALLGKSALVLKNGYM